MQPIELSFISEPQDILTYLQENAENGTVVGISAPVLGNGVFLTAVDQIAKTDNDYLIHLKGYDITGYILERNRIRLSDVRAICPFRSKFKNPYLKELSTGEAWE